MAHPFTQTPDSRVIIQMYTHTHTLNYVIIVIVMRCNYQMFAFSHVYICLAYLTQSQAPLQYSVYHYHNSCESTCTCWGKPLY